MSAVKITRDKERKDNFCDLRNGEFFEFAIDFVNKICYNKKLSKNTIRTINY